MPYAATAELRENEGERVRYLTADRWYGYPTMPPTKTQHHAIAS
jgi:hypothetical protein